MRRHIALAAVVPVALGVVGAPVAHAELCCLVQDVGRTGTREICDTPLRPNGTWDRHRLIKWGAFDDHDTDPAEINCYGSWRYPICDDVSGQLAGRLVRGGGLPDAGSDTDAVLPRRF